MAHIGRPILLAGGSGTGLWSLSHKSFTKLLGEESLVRYEDVYARGQGAKGINYPIPPLRMTTKDKLKRAEVFPTRLRSTDVR